MARFRLAPWGERPPKAGEGGLRVTPHPRPSPRAGRGSLSYASQGRWPGSASPPGGRGRRRRVRGAYVLPLTPDPLPVRGEGVSRTPLKDDGPVPPRPLGGEAAEGG